MLHFVSPGSRIHPTPVLSLQGMGTLKYGAFNHSAAGSCSWSLYPSGRALGQVGDRQFCHLGDLRGFLGLNFLKRQTFWSEEEVWACTMPCLLVKFQAASCGCYLPIQA